jgi:hypothetical protein
MMEGEELMEMEEGRREGEERRKSRRRGTHAKEENEWKKLWAR